MTGTCGPAAQAREHLDAVEVRQAEVEDDDVGWPSAHDARAPSAPSRRRATSYPRARRLIARARRICGSSSTTSTQVIGVIVGGAVRSRRSADEPPAASAPSSGRRRGCPRRSSVPPIASVKPAGDAPARARARLAGVSPSRWNGSKIRLLRGRPATPGPWSTTRTSTDVADAAPPTTRTPGPGGEWRHGVLDEVGDDPLEQPGVGAQQRQRRRPGRRTHREPGPGTPLDAGRGTTSSSATGRSAGHHAGLEPAHVEQVVDQPVAAGRPTPRRRPAARRVVLGAKAISLASAGC